MTINRSLILATLYALCITSVYASPTNIDWWHAMSGTRGKVLQEMVDKYNKSQNKYTVNAIYKGNYTETLNAAIAAYRAKKQPHLVQVFEVGTMTMMNSQAIYPIHQLFKDAKLDIDWQDFLKPIYSFYADKDNKLLSMPFNSSTPILYFNKKLLANAKIINPPQTWQQLHTDSQKIVEAGAACGTVIGWQSWVLLENFSAIHNLPFSSQENGFAGIKPQLTFNHPSLIDNIKRLSSGIDKGIFSYEGRRGDPARSAFLSGKCAFYMDSSSSIGSVAKLAKFPWGASPLPHTGKSTPKNSIIGGATLWVFKGHRTKEYAATADFLKFLSSSKNQIWWHKATGYLPITLSSYKKLKKDNYYQKHPSQEVPILQLTRGTPNANSRGIRLGSFTQIRDIINEELEKVWAKKISAKQGIDAAIKRGNLVLKKYARAIGRNR